MSSSRIAIIGASGFLGREISTYFFKKSVETYLLSKNGGSINNIPIDSVDILDNKSLQDWISDKDIRTLIYLSSLVPHSFEAANWDLFQKNIAMHKTILDVWKKKKFHLIYASGCSVYGRTSPLPWIELGLAMPDNYYTASKFMGEIFFSMESMHNLPLTILRINAPYGIHNRNKTVVNIFLERSLEDSDLILHGTGQREQDFIYVKDVARAFWQAYQEKRPGIYNIASGTTVTMKELAELIITLTHSKSRIIYSGKGDPQEKVKVSIDVSKAQKELGFSPEFSLSEGLLDCIHEYQMITSGR